MVILLTTVVTGAGAFLVINHLTELDKLRLIIAVTGVMFLADILIALSMEAVAPNLIIIGPGERQFNTDTLAEQATVISDFDSTGHGRVSIRGESWKARYAPDDDLRITSGTIVQVVSRDGLTLIVSSIAS